MFTEERNGATSRALLEASVAAPKASRRLAWPQPVFLCSLLGALRPPSPRSCLASPLSFCSASSGFRQPLRRQKGGQDWDRNEFPAGPASSSCPGALAARREVLGLAAPALQTPPRAAAVRRARGAQAARPLGLQAVCTVSGAEAGAGSASVPARGRGDFYFFVTAGARGDGGGGGGGVGRAARAAGEAALGGRGAGRGLR